MKFPQEDKHICYRCKTWVENPDPHHIFNGAFRDFADEDGYVIYVHRQCHELIHRNAAIRLKLKAEAQKDYEAKHGHEAYMKRYRKSYL